MIDIKYIRFKFIAKHFTMDAKLEVTNLITPLLNGFKMLSAEWKNFFEIGLEEYLQTQTEKYYFTNTFLHRGEKVVFKDIYYPIKATYRKLTTDFSDIHRVLEDYKNITLVGSAGSGKTTLLKYIFLNTIEKSEKIPVLIELRNLNNYDGDFEKLITEKILKSRVKPSDDTFKRALESGLFFFLFDGYDEIASVKKQEINRQIELFVDSYSMNNFLITTRPGSGIESFSRFCDFRVTSLEVPDVIGFISKIVENKERRERIIQVIDSPQNDDYLDYLSNPLLLSMFILAFESHPEIPAKKSAFYRNVFDTLYSKHDGITKNSFPREKLTTLQRDDFEKVLMRLSFLATMEGRYSYTSEYLVDNVSKLTSDIESDFSAEELIYDLQTSISIIVLDGFEYSFPHRSMQEYFTAMFVSRLPSDKKNIVYKKIANSFSSQFNDMSFNLFNLCEEIDEAAFILYFMLPHLKQIQRYLDKDSDRDLLMSFFEIYELYLVLNSDEKKAFDFSFICIDNMFSILLEQKINLKLDTVLQFINRPNVAHTIIEFYPDINALGYGVLFSKILKDNRFKKVMLENGVIEIIKGCKNKINDKILRLEEKLKQSNDSLESILGISN